MGDIKIRIADEDLSGAEKEIKAHEDAGIKIDDDGVAKISLDKQAEDEIDDNQEGSEDQEDQKANPDETVDNDKLVDDNALELIVDDADEEDDGDDDKKGEIDEPDGLEDKFKKEPDVDLDDDDKDAKVNLPENIEKLVSFMEETGGTLEDYVRLNTDYSAVDEQTLLREYYKQTKPHLDNEEIDFLLEDNFSFDEDIDDDRDIRRKKLAYKEEIAKAKGFLGDLKDKYYDEIKTNTKLAPEQQEALSFYDTYKKEQEELTAQQQKQSEHFTKQTESVFNEEFKGFEFKVGDNKYRYKVSDVQQTKEVQSDILNSFKTFLDDKNMLSDAQGYHKALFAARNADKIASHFYEQGKADAIRQLEAESNNINMDPRKAQKGFIDTNGIKIRAVDGDDSSKIRVKIRK